MYPLSKKWRSHFFEKKPLGVRVRATPRGFLPYLKGYVHQNFYQFGPILPLRRKSRYKTGKAGHCAQKEKSSKNIFGEKAHGNPQKAVL